MNQALLPAAHPGVQVTEPPRRAISPDCGALVISLDFELHWGIFPMEPVNGPYRANLLGARAAIPRMLELFEQRRIAVTWAVVGFLLARHREELWSYFPRLLPTYQDPRMNPYAIEVGESEEDDPLHFGASLVDRILQTPLQELGSHTFSHFCCLEPGQTVAQFRADLESALAISASWGVIPRSLVLPRNQHNPEYSPVIRELGFVCYRGNEESWMYRPCPASRNRGMVMRLGRAADAYLPLSGANTIPWGQLADGEGLYNVRSSTVLRAYHPRLRAGEWLRRRRILQAMEQAARHGEVFHIYWHPHNFGVNLEENLAFLESLLAAFAELQRRYGMQSATMLEVAQAARQTRSQDNPGAMPPGKTT